MYKPYQLVRFITDSNQYDPRQCYSNQIGTITYRFKNKLYGVRFGQKDYKIIYAYEHELEPYVTERKTNHKRQEFVTRDELEQFISDNGIIDYKPQLVKYSWVLWW